jgi:Zn-dependent alcohol dehydrogenase
MKTLSAIQLEPKGKLILDEIDIADPEKNQVQVKLISSGICHSQLHQMNDQNLPKPFLLGHEATGIVTKTGPDCTYVEEGDYVIVTWVSRTPIKGRNLPELNGVSYMEKPLNCRITFTWAETIMCDDQYVVKITEEQATDESCIVGCSVLTGAGAVKNTAKIKPGQTIAIFGAGGVGLSAITMASIMKASKIIVVDLDDNKLDFAKKFGATHVVNALKNDA